MSLKQLARFFRGYDSVPAVTIHEKAQAVVADSHRLIAAHATGLAQEQLGHFGLLFSAGKRSELRSDLLNMWWESPFGFILVLPFGGGLRAIAAIEFDLAHDALEIEQLRVPYNDPTPLVGLEWEDILFEAAIGLAKELDLSVIESIEAHQDNYWPSEKNFLEMYLGMGIPQEELQRQFLHRYNDTPRHFGFSLDASGRHFRRALA